MRQSVKQKTKKSSVWYKAYDAYVNIPIILPVFTVIYGASLTILAILHFFSLLAAVTTLFLAIFFTHLLIKTTSVVDFIKNPKEYTVFLTILLVYLVMWGIVGAINVQHNIFTYRDPAVYNVTAKYISNNISPAVPDYLVNIDDVTVETGGFYSDNKDNVSYHGLSLLPSITAAVSTISNDFNAFRTNILIAVVAIIALYFLGVMIMRPFMAFTMSVIFSISLPFIYFSRDMYTEILALLFSLSAIYFTIMCMNKPQAKLWFAAGLLLGASALTRIDALLFITPIVGYVVFVTTIRNIRAYHFYIGLFLMSILTTLNLVVLSSGYLNVHKKYLIAELSVLILVSIFAYITAKIVKSKNVMVKTSTSNNVVTVITIGIIGLSVLSLFRGLWLPVKDFIIDFRVIGGREVVLQNPEDAIGQVYNASEPVILWIGSYIGYTTLVVGFIGLLYIAYKSIKSADTKLQLIVFAFIPVSFVYFIYPAITPDHIWAIRRFLPVTIPLIFIIIGYIVNEVYKVIPNRLWNKIFAGTAIVLISLPVLNSSYKYIAAPLNQGSLAQITAICDSLPKNTVLIWGGSMGQEAIHPTNAYCKVDSVRLKDYSKASRAEVANAIIKEGKVPIIGYAAPQNLIDGIELKDMSFVYSLTFDDLKMRLYTSPDSTIRTERSIVLGVINADGSTSPINLY